MQQAFATALLNADLAPPAGLKTWNGSDPAVRFAVYRNNVMRSLMDALADTYPVVQQLVGETFFHAMAHAHVRQHLPTSPVLALYGAGFADLIEHFPPASCLPYLADVARLEWACVCAFHAADIPPLPSHVLAAQLTEPQQLARLRLQFAPHVKLIRSSFSVLSLWSAHQGDTQPGAMDWSQAQDALVVRPQLQVQAIAIPRATAHFVQALMSGHSLGSAYELCAPHAGLDVQAIFSLLLQTRALAALHTPS